MPSGWQKSPTFCRVDADDVFHRVCLVGAQAAGQGVCPSPPSSAHWNGTVMSDSWSCLNERLAWIDTSKLMTRRGLTNRQIRFLQVLFVDFFLSPVSGIASTGRTAAVAHNVSLMRRLAKFYIHGHSLARQSWLTFLVTSRPYYAFRQLSDNLGLHIDR